MGKTFKRQQARARKLKDAVSNSTPVTMNDALWATLEDALIGLLHIEVVHSSKLIDHVYPRSVQLIVRLDLVRAGASDTVERVLQRVMDALGMLCVLLEDSGDHPGVWTRAFRSQMMITPWDTEYTTVRSYEQRPGLRELLSQMMVSPWHALEDEDVMRVVAASTKAHGIHVVFAWQERRFHSYAADAIGAFLRTPLLHYERCLGGSIMEKRPRLVRVGIQFAGCQLTTLDMVSVVNALTIKELTAAFDFKDVPLSGVYTLESLTFKGVLLREAELDALAVGLASPHTRRVDGLSLEKMLTNSPKYVLAFKKVLAAAFQSKHSEGLTVCPGLKLSLAHNDLIQPVHVDALQEALTLATRPLSALSVANIPSGDTNTWIRLGQIIFTPSRIPVDGLCELDVSRSMEENNVAEALSLSLRTLVADMFPRITAALSASHRVSCRVACGENGDEDGGEKLSPLELYEVVSVRGSGESLGEWLQIKTPSAPESSKWISSSSISCLRIGEEDVVDCRFTSLVARGDDEYTYVIDGVPRLLNWIGHGLRYLDLGDRKRIPFALSDVMVSCPNLQVLDLQDSHLPADWDDMPLHSLKSINLRDCWLTARSMTDLLTRILATPEAPLRYLDLRGNSDFDSDTLDALLKLLQRNRALVHVEIPYTCLASDVPEEVALRRKLEEIDEYLLGEYSSAESKLAMLSVAENRSDLRWDEYIVHNILEFTASDRVVGWMRSCMGRCNLCSDAEAWRTQLEFENNLSS